ncbi:hypothetical protein ACFYNO_07295 [Kitasatospora sp. NPDC006697]|uniref:hypothetical protein n=1 Tax=Kitasatospora sp. NPDC006697 TaxID=3364020 RepID=UPI0036941B88
MARSRGNAVWPAPTVRRLARYAAFAPLPMLGVGVLGTGPDWFWAAFFLGIVVAVAALSLLMGLAARGLVFFGGLIASLAVMLGAGLAFESAWEQQNGQLTEVRVTAVHRSSGRNGPVYTCLLQRTDGRPLPHAEITDGCDGSRDAGTTRTLLVDRTGWVEPKTAGADRGPKPVGLAVVALAVGLYELLVRRVRGLALREAAAAPAPRAPGGPAAAVVGARNRSRKKRVRR